MDFAPISLFVYNRVDYLEQTINSLLKNNEANQTDLLIYSDGIKNDAPEEDKRAVASVREYIKQIRGFKSIAILERKSNMGLANSIVDGVGQTLTKYGSTIVLEDDLLVAPFFLKYMNSALRLYRDQEQVISIHAHNFPVKKSSNLQETFFLKGADCLGWATWRRGWQLYEKDGKKLLDELVARKLSNEFDFDGTYPFTKMLEDQAFGKNTSWAIRWHASAFLKNKLTLYPRLSLINHIGLTGTNYDADPFFDAVNLIDEVKVNPIKVEENDNARKALVEFYAERKEFLENRYRNKMEFNKWEKLKISLRNLFRL